MAAVWCHWCHVMESTTYRDPAIQQRIADKFIAVRVDQDADPALSYRYENWGWPATIMLDKDGNEIFKRRGYIPPELFAKLLVAVIEDPSALPSYTTARDGRSQRRRLCRPNAPRKHRGAAAQELRQGQHGGFGDTQRFIHGDTLEWALERSRPLQRNADTGDLARRCRRARSPARAG